MRGLLTVLVISVILLGACTAPSAPPVEKPAPPKPVPAPAPAPIPAPSTAPKPAPTPTPTPTPTQVVLQTAVSPPGGGTVSPSGGTYDSGTRVRLIATPSAGYKFTSWSGDVPAGVELCPDISIPIDRDLTIQANFEFVPGLEPPSTAPGPFVLRTVIDPPGGGSVSPSGGTYNKGTMLNVEATPSPGYWFVYWSGDVPFPGGIALASNVWIPMDRERTLQAHFELIPTPAPGPFVLRTVVDPPRGGSVSPSSGTYGRGTKVTVTATPSPGYRFVSWSGEVQSTSQTISTYMNCDWTLQAHFELIPTPTIQGTKIQLQSPLYNERFVQGETVQFEATVTCEPPCDGSQLQWTSERDGRLGNGRLVSTSGLSVGTHTITVSGYGTSETFPVRVFAHLGDLYRAPPAEGEIQRILSHFTFVWENGSGNDENWSAYDSFNFDQNSTNPSKVVIMAKLDVMRHQRFSEPLPMTNGKTIYDHLRTWVNTICLRLDCGVSGGGDGQISLMRVASVWDARVAFGGCKIPLTPPEFWPYIYQLQLFVHECRHCEQGDPLHTDCGQGGPAMKDYQLEGGSGYAWGALYQMWVYKYSLYDPADIRNAAKQEATMFLRDRFCTTPSHSDSRVQAIIQELLGQ